MWSGDQLISDLTDYYVSDPLYARDSLGLFLTHPASTADFLIPTAGVMSQPGPLPGACSPNPAFLDNECVTWSAGYSVVVIPALYNYYLYTGDLAFIRRHWQAVVRQMQWDAQQVGANGLFTVNAADADDWNLESPTGEVSYVNAVYVEALQAASKLAAALGDATDATRWSASASAVARAVNARLWNAKTGVYDASASIHGSVVQDANVMAILSGIASPTRARSIIGVLRRALATPYGPAIATTDATGYVRDVSPYMSGFNVLADFASGEDPDALALIRQEWGFIDLPRPGRRRMGADRAERHPIRDLGRSGGGRLLGARVGDRPDGGAVEVRARRLRRRARLRELDGGAADAGSELGPGRRPDAARPDRGPLEAQRPQVVRADGRGSGRCRRQRHGSAAFEGRRRSPGTA